MGTVIGSILLGGIVLFLGTSIYSLKELDKKKHSTH